MALLVFAIFAISFMKELLIFKGGITMRFREVERNIEKEKLNKKKEEFKKIKPETDITIDEAKAFMNSLFASARES